MPKFIFEKDNTNNPHHYEEYQTPDILSVEAPNISRALLLLLSEYGNPNRNKKSWDKFGNSIGSNADFFYKKNRYKHKNGNGSR